MLPLEHREEGRVHLPLPYHLLLITEPLTRPPQLLFLPRRTFQLRPPLHHPLYPPHRRICHHPPHHHHLGISALTRARHLARPRRRHVNSSKQRAAGHVRHCRTSLEGSGGFSTTLLGRGRTDGEAARVGARGGEIIPRGRVGVEVGVDLGSGLEGLTMEAQETRAAVLTNNSLSSNVQMVGRRGWGQEGTYRAGMRISIKLDISSSLGLPTLYFPRV